MSSVEDEEEATIDPADYYNYEIQSLDERNFELPNSPFFDKEQEA